MKKLISILAVAVSVFVVMLFAFISPLTLFKNAREADYYGGPVKVYIFMAVAILVVSPVFLILIGVIKRSVFAGMDRLGDGGGKAVPLIAAYKQAGPAGRAERFLLRALMLECAGLAVTGYGQYSSLMFYNIYWRVSLAHTLLGLLTVVTVVFYLRKLTKRHFSPRLSWLVTMYPFIYLLILQTPGPLLAQFLIINILLLPFGILTLMVKETAPERRPAVLFAAAALFAFVIVCMTGTSPVVDPIHLRFSFRHRIIHAVLTPIAILLPFYYFRSRRSGAALTPDRRAFMVLGALVLAGMAAGTIMHAEKGHRLQKNRERNRYYSASLAKKDNVAFRQIAPGVMSDDAFCARCHRIPFKQWKRGVHANAARLKTFQHVVKTLMKKHGPEIALMCAACHDPEVAYLKKPELLVSPEHLKKSQGIGCRTCHYMSSAGDKNFWYALDIPRSDLEPAPVRRRDIRIRFTVQEHVGDVTKPITLSGEVCFPCHSLRSMRAGHEHVPIDNVTSFQKSSFSKRMPCHRCHMPRIEKDERSYSWMDHSFFGIFTQLGDIVEYAPDVKRKDIAAFSKDTSLWLDGRLPVLNIMESTMDETFKSYRPFGYLRRFNEIRETITVASGGPHFTMRLKDAKPSSGGLRLAFATKNINAGHDFPTNLFANITKAWFGLEITDADGRSVYSSGYVENDLTHQLGRVEVLADGTPIVPGDSLKYVNIINKKYIEPEKEYVDEYTVPGAAALRYPLKAVYTLNYKRYNDGFVEEYTEGEGRPVPVRVLAKATFTISKPTR